MFRLFNHHYCYQVAMTTNLDDGFQKVIKRNGKVRKQLPGGKQLELQLNEARIVIRESLMFASIREFLDEHKEDIKCVRCLALGCFSEDAPARYQLALLMEMISILQLEKCSLFDPAFNKQDLEFIQQNEKWVVEETPSFESDIGPESILFFLPHAPLSLTESVIISESPKYWLANNLLRHTDRYTKSQLHQKYPHISLLTHYMNKNHKPIVEDDGFTTFTSKRRRNQKNIFQEAKIDYNAIDSPYKECVLLLDFENGAQLCNHPWNNAFSDLALHCLKV